MKKFKKLIVLSLISLAVVSCKKEKVKDVPNQESKAQQEEKNWETTDPVIIAKIIADMNRASTESDHTVNYRNFNILYNDDTPSDILPLIKGEIDDIYNSDISRSVIPQMDDIQVINISAIPNGGLLYQETVVIINDYDRYRNVKSGKGNVLFHELIHYMHDKKIPGGYGNEQNLANYNRVVSQSVYPQGSYVNSTQEEYLATSAEAFFTETARPPYDRATVERDDSPMSDFIDTNL